MNRSVPILASLVLACGLSACGSQDKHSAPADTSPSPASLASHAAPNITWQEGFAQGVSEYSVQSEGLRLVVSCTPSDGVLELTSSVSLDRIGDGSSVKPFTINVNGHSFQGPVKSDSRVGSENFRALISDLRQSSFVVAFGQRAVTFPLGNAATLLPDPTSTTFSCNTFM